ncbi:MAG: glycosyltransferase family 1 protein [Anaerolineae bacterium]|nr:glycosyltransferase family 1 protein [Anaerolineae bacterium]
MTTAILHMARTGFEYDLDWRDALLAYPGIDAQAFDWRWTSPLLYGAILQSEYLIVLHSIDPGYATKRSAALAYLLQKRRGKLIYFPRNEYKDFSYKRRFIQQAGVDLVCSLLPQESADYLYGDLTKTISLPHATNLSIYSPNIPPVKRKTIIGSRTARYPPILLDNSRNELADVITQIGHRKPQWLIDYSDNLADRFDRAGWAHFLNQTICTISTEAGAIYLDKSDQIQKDIENHVAEHPNLDAQALYQLFKPRIDGLPSGKHITSRHFEAMGCMTCQVLVAGTYNGLLEPDVHYIPLSQDFANLDEALEKIEDSGHTQQIATRCYELVKSCHLHKHRVAQLWQEMQWLA